MITITRWYQPDCTLGRLRLGDFQCFTLELPDLDNQNGISCIPEGDYPAFYRISPKNGPCIELMSVPNRTHIQIHAGNYVRQIEGCILPGDSIALLDDDKIPDVPNSKRTLTKLLDLIPKEGTFNVRIETWRPV